MDVRVSSWARAAPNTFPTLAKSAANYANSQLIKMEAVVEGYSEGIALDTNGQISEGSGQNLFLVRDEILYTPPLSAAILPGITRSSIIQIARDLGFTVVEEPLPRELLYIVDEAFFVGTAAEVTPIKLGGQDHRGQRPSRPGHRSAPEGVLRRRQRGDTGPARLAVVTSTPESRCKPSEQLLPHPERRRDR